MLKVGLIQIGGNLPNLALMRLSAYHKAMGDEVLLNPQPLDCPSMLYISTLFTWRRSEVEEIRTNFGAFADVQVGGSGWDLNLTLPHDIDCMPNDYSLYGIDYGIGYTSRGCIRDCEFCPVPQAEGWVREDRAIADLLNPRSNRLILMDNNFFASNWRPKIAEIERRGVVVDWPQGNDIRLMTPEIAAALGTLRSRSQIMGSHLKRANTLHFAWDKPSTDAKTAQVVRGIRELFKVGFTPHDLIFYVLIGFPGYEVEEELFRINTLHAMGIHPYVMVYRDYGEKDTRDPVRMDIQHWNASYMWRKVPFSQYDRKLCDRAA